MLTADYAEDMGHCTIAEIEVAVREYRRSAENQFFPKVGQLLEIIMSNRKHRAEVGPSGPRLVPEFGKPRPTAWWMQAKQLWQADWKESEVPNGNKIRDVIGGPLRDPGHRVF